MSGEPSQRLQRHKDAVKDTLQGLLGTFASLPSLIHAATSKEVVAAANATAARQAAHKRTQQSLDALPKELAAFDTVLDDVLSRSHDIQQSLATLRAFSSRPSGAQQQQQKQQQTPPTRS